MRLPKQMEDNLSYMKNFKSLSDDARKTLTAADINARIIIGGHPVTAEACQLIGADGYTVNAAEGVKICQSWMAS